MKNERGVPLVQEAEYEFKEVDQTANCRGLNFSKFFTVKRFVKASISPAKEKTFTDEAGDFGVMALGLSSLKVCGLGVLQMEVT